MRIGITERGDAALDYTWTENLHKVDAAVLITKNLTPEFVDCVTDLHQKSGYPIIVHATCTGWGGTALEPGVPDYRKQLNHLRVLIINGFPGDRCVLRVDPIFPTEIGMKRVANVLDYADALGLMPMRVRVSLLDEYQHVKNRFRNAGYSPCYGESFCADEKMTQQAAKVLKSLSEKHGITFESCAEPLLAKYCGSCMLQLGCISDRDIKILGLQHADDLSVNPQFRTGCRCLSCKTELLGVRHPCGHRCMYCYWKDHADGRAE